MLRTVEFMNTCTSFIAFIWQYHSACFTDIESRKNKKIRNNSFCVQPCLNPGEFLDLDFSGVLGHLLSTSASEIQYLYFVVVRGSSPNLELVLLIGGNGSDQPRRHYFLRIELNF